MYPSITLVATPESPTVTYTVPADSTPEGVRALAELVVAMAGNPLLCHVLRLQFERDDNAFATEILKLLRPLVAKHSNRREGPAVSPLDVL